MNNKSLCLHFFTGVHIFDKWRAQVLPLAVLGYSCHNDITKIFIIDLQVGDFISVALIIEAIRLMILLTVLM